MSAQPHITVELAKGYWEKALRPEALLRVAGHLDVCEPCRRLIASLQPDPGGETRLREALAGPHLTYETLEGLVHGSSEGLEHIAWCEVCAAEFRDLKAFQQDLRKAAPPRARWLRWPVLAPAAVALAAIVLAVSLRPARQAAPTAVAPPPVVALPVIALPVIALQDGVGLVSLTADGRVTGLGSVSADESRVLAEVLRAGQLALAPADPSLGGTREILLGDPRGPAPGSQQAETAILKPLSPAATAVVDTRPVFRWQAPRGARDFRVEVYASNFERVTASPVLQSSEWQPAEALARGRTYNWTISALVNGARVSAPRPPEPEARFRVASAQEAAQLEPLLSASPRSDLRLMVAAARLGFAAEAREAAVRLVARNPGSELASRLLLNLKTQPR